MEQIYLVIINATDCEVVYHNFSVVKNEEWDYDEDIDLALQMLVFDTDMIERMAQIGKPFTIRTV